MNKRTVSQVKLAEALGVSRSVIRQRLRLGMPDTSIKAAKAWSRAHVAPRRSGNLIAEKRKLLRTKIERAEMRLRAEASKLIPIESSRRAWHSTILPVVREVMRIPHAIAPQIAAATNDPGRCEEIFRDALQRTLERISASEWMERQMAKAGVAENLGQRKLLAG